MKSLGKKLPFLVVGTIAVCSVWFMLSLAPAGDRGEIQNVASRFFSLFRSSDREGAAVNINASVHGGGRYIENEDNFPWTNVKVKITHIGKNGGKWVWEDEIDRLDPGHRHHGSYVRVKTDAGYNGQKVMRSELRIWADTPKGKGFYAYDF